MRHLSYRGINFCILCRRSLRLGLEPLCDPHLRLSVTLKTPTGQEFLGVEQKMEITVRKVRDVWSMIKHIPAESGDVLTVESCVATDLAKQTMNFDRRSALCIQKLYHRPHFTVRGAGIRASIFNICSHTAVRSREVPVVHTSYTSLLYHVQAVA